MDQAMYILIVGDPVEGFTYHGPFKDEHEAVSYGEQHYSDTSWWTVGLADKEDLLTG
jgi:hypothetical protein